MRRILSRNRALLILDVEMDSWFTFSARKGYVFFFFLFVKFHH